jgi:PH (Pleckstrin Homology) domain-containing protein
MKDRLRAARDAAAELAEKAQRLLPGGSSDDDDVTVEDDDEDEDLPDLEVSDEDHMELAHLDDEHDAAPLTMGEAQVSIFEQLHKIDPTPSVPLTEKHEVGLVSLLDRFAEMADTGAGVLEDKRTRKIMDLVGDRLSISVSPDGITVRSLLRRKHTPWKRVQGVTIEGRYDLVRNDGMAKLLEGVQSPFPVPGLGWLLRRVTKGIAVWVERRLMTEEGVAAAHQSSGIVLLGVKRWGRDIELDGPLLLVAFMAPGLAVAVEQEARMRGIPVEVTKPEI